jgi:hypothetical protein
MQNNFNSNIPRYNTVQLHEETTQVAAKTQTGGKHDRQTAMGQLEGKHPARQSTPMACFHPHLHHTYHLPLPPLRLHDQCPAQPLIPFQYQPPADNYESKDITKHVESVDIDSDETKPLQAREQNQAPAHCTQPTPCYKAQDGLPR